ncbi:PREDICTED: GSK-3-binding protein FRAT2 [Chinchilla lanigera]|uniref:GSK-3-binding protein FRAT2 n=1 Tax=Chinchilla lanigera TaxID=34839 RepID=UPI0006970737|nr:PREDICTED: GSK-3-binding protein FRAT2 [Chinchilla lanigera]
MGRCVRAWEEPMLAFTRGKSSRTACGSRSGGKLYPRPDSHGGQTMNTHPRKQRLRSCAVRDAWPQSHLARPSRLGAVERPARRHPLFTNQPEPAGFRLPGCRRRAPRVLATPAPASLAPAPASARARLRRAPPDPRAAEPPPPRAGPGAPGRGAMPCRREEEEDAGEEAEGEEEEGSFLLLEQSVTLGGSGEVDRLVAQIGETLQLDAARDSPASPRAPPGPPLQPPRPAPVSLRLPPASAEAGSPAPPGAVRCGLGDRGRVRGRAAPYCVAELPAGPSALSAPCRRGWLRGAVASRRLQQRRWTQAGARACDDDPHRLLQQLVLSGNLIKEAVRRLQRAVAAVAATSPASAPGPEGTRSGPDSVALQTSGAVL